jgi:flagellar hook-basal body complex protein FliE
MSPVASPTGAAGLQQILALRQQIVDRTQLLQQLHTPYGGAVPPASNGPTGSFTDTLKSALDGVNSTQANADSLTTAYQKGEVTDVAKVMLARQESSLAFEATLQVRNRLLSAYQDIMRMGV